MTQVVRFPIHLSLMHISTAHGLSAFPIILDCFNVLLKRLSDELWNGESPEYPQVVFDSIKDNPSFLNLIQSTDPLRENFQPLGWFGAYIDTLRGKPVYSEVLAKMADFMCEELQHERFKDTRPVIMVSAVKVSSRTERVSLSLTEVLHTA